MNHTLKLVFISLCFLYSIPNGLPLVPEYDTVSQRMAEPLLFPQPTEFSHSYL